MTKPGMSQHEFERSLIEKVACRLREYWYQDEQLKLIFLAGTEKQRIQLREADVFYQNACLSIGFGQYRRAGRELAVFHLLCQKVFADPAMIQAQLLLEKKMNGSDDLARGNARNYKKNSV